MKKKVKFSLLTTFIVLIALSITGVYTSAYSTCEASSKTFRRTYEEDAGCSEVNVPVTLTKKSASTRISAPSGCGLNSYVIAWESDGDVIDSSTHQGSSGNSTATIIWLISTPARTQHDGIVTSGTAGGCKGYHTRQYR